MKMGMFKNIANKMWEWLQRLSIGSAPAPATTPAAAPVMAAAAAPAAAPAAASVMAPRASNVDMNTAVPHMSAAMPHMSAAMPHMSVISQLPQEAIHYSRISSPDQNTLTQVSKLEAYSETNYYTVIDRLNETGSAWTSTPELEFEAFISRHKDLNLIVFDASRFARNSEYGARLMRICRRNRIAIHIVGVAIPYVCKGLDNSGRLTDEILRAEIEGDIKSDRARDMARARREKEANARAAPDWTPRPIAPFGFKYRNPTSRELLPENNPEKVAHIATILEIMRKLIYGVSKEEMAAFYVLFNSIPTRYTNTSKALGGEYGYILVDDEDDVIEQFCPGQSSPQYMYTLFNNWNITFRSSQRWTLELMEDAILRHFGQDALEMTRRDLAVADTEMAVAQPDAMEE